MIKVIVVDDDIEMLEGMKHIIKWKEFGFDIVATATNGEEGQRQFQIHKPEVLITDITMPVMDGFLLAEKALSINPKLCLVFVTCHESFEYAQKAIALNVVDYWSKMFLSMEQIKKTLFKIQERLKQISQSESAQILGYNDESNLVNFLLDALLKHTKDKTSFIEKLYDMNLIEKGRPYRTVEVCAFERTVKINQKDLFQESQTLLEKVYWTIKEAQFTQEWIVFHIDMTRLFILIYDDSNTIDHHVKLDIFIRKLQELFVSEAIDLGFCVAPRMESLVQLSDAVKFCKNIESDFYYEPMSIRYEKKEFAKASWSANQIKNYVIDMNTCMIQGDKEKVSERFEEFIETARIENWDPIYIEYFLRQCIQRIEVDIHRINDIHGVVDKITSINQAKKVFEKLIETTGTREDGIQSNRRDITQIIEHIKSHLDGDISCSDAAARLHMNVNYFSRLFKKETGFSFTEFVTKKKIERITDLLANSESSLKEIGEAVGINDISYLCKIYKKQTGETPSEARRRLFE